jgi:hypothetical protein
MVGQSLQSYQCFYLCQESMSTNIMFKNSPLIKAKTKDKREIYAFQFTGTDENISKIVRTHNPYPLV